MGGWNEDKEVENVEWEWKEELKNGLDGHSKSKDWCRDWGFLGCAQYSYKQFRGWEQPSQPATHSKDAFYCIRCDGMGCEIYRNKLFLPEQERLAELARYEMQIWNERRRLNRKG